MTMSTHVARLVLMSPRNPEPTRTAVLAAADELLEAGGPDAVTLRAVGAAAGVSRSAPYRHFDGKAELLEAVALRTLTDLGAAIRAAAKAADQSVQGYVIQACIERMKREGQPLELNTPDEPPEP